MKFKRDFLICNDKDDYFFVHNETKKIIPNKYEIIIQAIENGITEETEIIKKLLKNDISETEAAVLCAEFIMEYSDELESE